MSYPVIGSALSSRPAPPHDWWDAGDDTIRFTSPTRLVQRPLFAVLAPLARLRGLHGRYPHDEQHTGPTVDVLEALPPDVVALLPTGA